MKVYTAFNIRPISYNKAKTEAKREYIDELKDQFEKKYQALYSGLPFTETVETRIAYFNRVRYQNQKTDIDNISKPIVDAYKGLIYQDDRQVIQRIAMRYDMDSVEILDIDCSEMPYQIKEEFDRYMESKCEHLLVFSVAPITRKDLMEI